MTKFEKKIRDWNCLRKLKNRDKELSDIKSMIESVEKFIEQEDEYVDFEINYYDKKMAKNPTDQNLIYYKEAVENYLSDLESLTKKCNEISMKRAECWEEFDERIEPLLKHDQNKTGRLSIKLENHKNLDFNAKIIPQDEIYLMAHISCTFKKRIQALRKDLDLLEQKRIDLI